MTAPAHSQETTIELKISEEHKETLEKAAAMTGLSLNDYVVHQALTAAMDHIASYGKMVLSDRDREIFMAALENPSELNPRLKAAIKSYRDECGQA
ncbi:type II toxin-antitoxin system TacA family antitoxin [Kamptonema formosum]|uniref:type II toxin-antitoxin system TacA family antitoxin n=1 Tax=Kamptonema formosum TaxID=331992 RepID=UPI00034DC26E|nr:DUF1778 domain-containing protein [Oscillatoria sp. PCC 10802]